MFFLTLWTALHQVVDHRGCVVGLVTSHAKQADGTVIPSLNFSIAAGALRHIRAFVETEDLTLLTVSFTTN